MNKIKLFVFFSAFVRRTTTGAVGVGPEEFAVVGRSRTRKTTVDQNAPLRQIASRLQVESPH